MYLDIIPSKIYAANSFPALMLSLCPVAEILHPFTFMNFNVMTQKLVQCNGSPEQKKNWPSFETRDHYLLLKDSIPIGSPYFSFIFPKQLNEQLESIYVI